MKIQMALILSGLAMGAHADVVAFTSFEGGTTGTRYYDLINGDVDHDLVNHDNGEQAVDFVSDGIELGVDAYFRTSGSNGLFDGDFVGFTSFTGDVGSFTDGSQGYQIGDTDGIVGLTFDSVTAASLSSVSIDINLRSTGYESSDFLRIWAVVDGGVEIDLINTIGTDIDTLGIENQWTTVNADLTGYTTVQIMVEGANNSSQELYFLDNLVINGTPVPTPGAVALMGLGGLLVSRRRR